MIPPLCCCCTTCVGKMTFFDERTNDHPSHLHCQEWIFNNVINSSLYRRPYRQLKHQAVEVRVESSSSPLTAGGEFYFRIVSSVRLCTLTHEQFHLLEVFSRILEAGESHCVGDNAAL